MITAEHAEKWFALYSRAKTWLLEQLTDGAWHAKEALGAAIPPDWAATAYALSGSSIHQDHPDRDRLIAAMYGGLIVTCTAQWMAADGLCEIDYGGPDMTIRLAPAPAPMSTSATTPAPGEAAEEATPASSAAASSNAQTSAGPTSSAAPAHHAEKQSPKKSKGAATPAHDEHEQSPKKSKRAATPAHVPPAKKASADKSSTVDKGKAKKDGSVGGASPQGRAETVPSGRHQTSRPADQHASGEAMKIHPKSWVIAICDGSAEAAAVLVWARRTIRSNDAPEGRYRFTNNGTTGVAMTAADLAHEVGLSRDKVEEAVAGLRRLGLITTTPSTRNPARFFLAVDDKTFAEARANS